MATNSSACPDALVVWCVYRLRDRLVDPYVQPVLYIRRPGSDLEETHRFPDDDPFFSEISNLIDVIEDIEEDPESAIILSSFEGAYLCWVVTACGVERGTFRRVQDLRAHLGHPPC